MANTLFSTCCCRQKESRCGEGGAEHPSHTLSFLKVTSGHRLHSQLEVFSSPALRVHWASVLLCYESLPFTEAI